jgi:hypothetical protein
MMGASRQINVLRRFCALGTEGGKMAFIMRIVPPNFTAEKYDEVVKRLEAAGEGNPTGRIFHVCFGDKNNLRVSDMWDTRENFDRFFGVVGGIMQDLGIGAAEPEFFEVHNTIFGEQARSTAG